MDPKEVWKKVFIPCPECMGEAWKFQSEYCQETCEYWHTCLFRIKKKARKEKSLTILGDKNCIRKLDQIK